MSVPVTHLSSAQRISQRFVQIVSTLANYLLGSGLLVIFGLNPFPNSPLSNYFVHHWLLSLGLLVSFAILVIASATIINRANRLTPRSFAIRLLRFVATSIAEAAIGALIGLILGFNSLSDSIPLIMLLHTHTPLALILVGGLLALIIVAPLFTTMESEHPGPDVRRPLFVATTISAISTTICVALVLLIVLRPPWCPQGICPPLAYNALGVHDANLEVSYAAEQSGTYFISADPTTYHSTDGLQATNVAIPSATSAPYRAIISLHNLQSQNPYALIIDKVLVQFVNVAPAPLPVNVWAKGDYLNYPSEPFDVVYDGQGSGAQLEATYVTVPGSHIQLRPGESDSLALHLIATSTAYLTFNIQVVYRVANANASHTLVVPHTYRVIFADVANWQVYNWQGNHFTLQP